MSPNQSLQQTRLLLVGLGVLSLIPFALHRVLAHWQIYDIRFMGGLHPVEILWLRQAGILNACNPAVISLAFILSFVRPRLTRLLLIACVTLSLVVPLLFLYCAITVIILNIQPSHT